MEMQATDSNSTDLERLPGRLFLDSSTLQTLEAYGEFVYDGDSIEPGARILAVPDGMRNCEALRDIMIVFQRGMFQLVLSENSLREVLARGRPTYLNWALEVLDYCQGILSQYVESGADAFSGGGPRLSEKITGPQFGYLSKKDRALLADALALECDAFLTMDKKLARNAVHVERETGLKILEPVQYWEILRPWAALFV